jgi:hypothetical protein
MKKTAFFILLLVIFGMPIFLAKCSVSNLKTTYYLLKGDSITEVPLEDSPVQVYEDKILCTSKELLYSQWTERDSYSFEILEYEITDEILFFKDERAVLERIPARTMFKVVGFYELRQLMHSLRHIVVVEIVLGSETLRGTMDFFDTNYSNSQRRYSLNEKFILSGDECNNTLKDITAKKTASIGRAGRTPIS